MVEEPTTVIRPPRPPRRHRTKASRGRILARRLIAFAFVLALLGLVVGSAWAIFRGGGEEQVAPPPQPVAPAPKVLKIIFPEGFTRADMAHRISEVNAIAKQKRKVTPRLSEDRYLALTDGASRVPKPFLADGKPPNLEGFLFPATYEFTAKTSSKQLVAKQVEAFQRNWKTVDLRDARKKNLTPYDVLIIASMIEKEVRVAKERPLVAAVIYNRLHVGLPLGIDATLRYGFDIPPTEAIRQSQLDSDSPYNTRKRPGLPPTPIANPGLASMQAAARPARKNYLYFIRRPDCRSHFFTASAREFDNYTRAGLQC